MSEDHIAEVDALLADTLPDDVDEISQETVADQRQQEMIELLKNAEEQLGRSPSLRDFQSLEFETSAYVIEKAFGTWNDAKRAAGLETYDWGAATMDRGQKSMRSILKRLILQRRYTGWEPSLRHLV